MIWTTLAHLSAYDGMGPQLRRAREALSRAAGEPFQAGRRTTGEDGVRVVSLAYETKDPEQAVFEAHRRCIDVMLLLEGEETIGILPLEELGEVVRPYDGADDALLARGSGWSAVAMRPGHVAVFFPEDAHAPGLDAGRRQRVRKLIAKVPVDR